jgi:hypothetical protein
VGSGGGPRYDFQVPQPNSEVRYNADWGVIGLTLVPRGYAWQYLGASDGRIFDAGRAACH